MSKSAIVVGAGIVGLATARALAIRGHKVTVLEREEKAIGASIRNFGMIWPIGQPDGVLYERAMHTKQIWRQICDEAAIWYENAGSLHLAYTAAEMQVLNELRQIYYKRSYSILAPDQCVIRSAAVNSNNLKGGLFSTEEMIVDPRLAIQAIPKMLAEKYGVDFIWGQSVFEVDHPSVYTGKTIYQADQVFICSGADFQTLYPHLLISSPITKCKLQMMRMVAQPGNWRIGAALCGGLSLVHYNSFKAAPGVDMLKKIYQHQYPEYMKWGIHVMVSQNGSGELTVGDSHEYGNSFDPFNKQFINGKILAYLKSFARFRDESVTETWNGIYPKLTDGRTELVLKPYPGVTIINGLGGAGMTLAFGLCEEIVSETYHQVGEFSE